MGFVNSLPGPFVTLSIERHEIVTDAYNNVISDDWNEVDNVQGKVQIGSMATAIVSDKYKSEVSAVAMVDPEDLTITITDKDRIIADGVTYSIIYVDNIEGVSVEIPLKLWEN
jgi:hypothetical protein